MGAEGARERGAAGVAGVLMPCCSTRSWRGFAALLTLALLLLCGFSPRAFSCPSSSLEVEALAALTTLASALFRLLPGSAVAVVCPGTIWGVGP